MLQEIKKKNHALLSSNKGTHVLPGLYGRRRKEEKAFQTVSHDLLVLHRLDLTFNLVGCSLIRTESH